MTNGSILCMCDNWTPLCYQKELLSTVLTLVHKFCAFRLKKMLSVLQIFFKNLSFLFVKRIILLIRNRAWNILSNMEQVKNFSSHYNTSQSWEYPRATHRFKSLCLSLSLIIWWNYLITYQCYFVTPGVCTSVLRESR